MIRPKFRRRLARLCGLLPVPQASLPMRQRQYSETCYAKARNGGRSRAFLFAPWPYKFRRDA